MMFMTPSTPALRSRRPCHSLLHYWDLALRPSPRTLVCGLVVPSANAVRRLRVRITNSVAKTNPRLFAYTTRCVFTVSLDESTKTSHFWVGTVVAQCAALYEAHQIQMEEVAFSLNTVVVASDIQELQGRLGVERTRRDSCKVLESFVRTQGVMGA